MSWEGVRKEEGKGSVREKLEKKKGREQEIVWEERDANVGTVRT